MSPVTGLVVNPTVSMAKLQSISQDLLSLKEFLESNKSFIDGLAGPDALGRASTKQDEISLQAEHRALHSLVVLVENIIEGIAFVQVLFEEQITAIMSSLSNETRQQVRNLTYEGLFSTANGKDMAKELVKAIVNRNIANGSNVETVAEALRRRCGTFCSAEDVIIFKAQELLKRSSEAGNESESGRNLLNESLRLFKQVAGSLTMEQLQWAVRNFTSMQFYAGAIQLALDVAKESDRGNRALAWIQEGRQAQVRLYGAELQNLTHQIQDPRATAFNSRKRCYNLIHEVIMNLDQASSQAPSMIDGQYTVTARRRTEAYDVIETSEDEAFQTDLYDWYLSQGRTDRLLEIHSPYIVTYLQRKAQDDKANADLLWRYHSQNGQHHEAARVQLDLAQSGFPLTLDQRIEYLGRAKANASTSTLGVARQTRYQLLRSISDLLDVANIQSDVLQRLRVDPRISAERRPQIEKELNGTMLPFNVVRFHSENRHLLG
jgi:nuclear pore complex protein Nup155